jgi:DNA processing protein
MSWNSYIGPKKFTQIIESFGEVEKFFELKPSQQMEFLNVKGEKAIPVFEKMAEEGSRIIEQCEKRGIKTLSIDEEGFPVKLRDIPDPPFLLYYYGELNFSIPLLAIVGTRDVSYDGEVVNKYFTHEISGYNIGIVSGLALGHDSIAQRTVIENGGYTIAVLGSGVDVAYPQKNSALYRDIKATGAIISEFPPGTRPERWHFPYRNRVISGLAEIVLVIQAPEKSGALITANYAIEQGKPLYVVPGSPMDKSSAGTNALINKGAKVALNPHEIVIELVGQVPNRKKPRSLEDIPELSGKERLILENMKHQLHIDEIANITEIPIAELNSLLVQMELNGFVTQYPGRYYERNV